MSNKFHSAKKDQIIWLDFSEEKQNSHSMFSFDHLGK